MKMSTEDRVDLLKTTQVSFIALLCAVNNLLALSKLKVTEVIE